MIRSFLISLVAGLIPIIVLFTMAIIQFVRYGYTRLVETILLIQIGYVILLIPIMIIFFVRRKNGIALGVLVSLVIGFFVAGATMFMGF